MNRSTSETLFSEIEERIRQNEGNLSQKGTKSAEKKVQPGSIRKSFNLLFCPRSPAELQKFHVKCDGKGPTLTVLHGAYNVMFGGYTTKSWSKGNKETKRDDHAFLFCKSDNMKENCMFFDISEEFKDRAITCDTNFGPTFGGGSFPWQTYDLQTFDLSSKKECMFVESETHEHYIVLNGNLNFNTAFQLSETEARESSNRSDKKGKYKSSDINGKTLEVKSIEVYQVLDDTLEKDWKPKPTKEELTQMTNYMLKLEPLHGLNIPHYNILLIGVIGAGKSAFYNTIASTFAEEVKHSAPSASEYTSITNELHVYDIITKGKQKLNVKLYDIRGFELTRTYEYELEHLLNGQLPKDYIFPEKAAPVPEDILEKHPSFKDEIHLVCFVMDSLQLKVQEESDEYRQAFQKIKQVIRRKHIPIAAVATKFDEVCPRIAENADNVYSSPKARDSVKMVAQFLGLSPKHVFPVVNYISDASIQDGKDRLAIQALFAMIKLAENHLEQHRAMAQKEDNWTARSKSFLDQVQQHGPESPLINEILEEVSKLNEMEKIDPKELRFLCAGAVRSGKSSFIDSVYSSMIGSIYSKAVGGIIRIDSGNKSRTEKFQLFPIKHKPATGRPQPINITLCDMPGIQDEGGVNLDHLKFIVRGYAPNKCKIVQEFEKLKQNKKSTGRKNRIHGVCFIFDLSNVDKISKTTQTTLKSFLDWLIGQDIPYIVVVTKGDELSNTVRDNTSDIYQNKRIKENKDTLLRMFGFKESLTFPVRNYVHEAQIVPECDTLLLDAFLHIIKLGVEYLEDFEYDLPSSDEEKETKTSEATDAK